MRRRGLRLVAAAVVAAAGLSSLNTAAAGHAVPAADDAAGSLCPPAAPTASPVSATGLRFGIDPGLAGNPLPSLRGPVPVDRSAELRALKALRPKHRALVIRMNRLFWSGGEKLLDSFVHDARRYARRGFDVEVQVRYHPTKADDGNLHRWTRWVRHVVDELGRIHRLVALTITNEVNFAISPNTSDGSYTSAKSALLRGVEAAYAELREHGWARRVKVGFTFAYRLNPVADSNLFSFLGSVGGAKFRHSLGFVGLDVYPGTVYPPALVPPIDTAADEMASAIATMRVCYLPLAGIGLDTPLWITENGYPSNGPADESQVTALREMVGAAQTYGTSYDVTDYRWFNLRDNNSNGSGLFDKDGLLRDHNSRKPSFTAYRELIKRFGATSG